MTTIADRYNKFQSDAVKSIVKDFRETRSGRYLLVIPTGGGKTKTAVKAIGALYAEGVLASHERVVWVVHREELHTQAVDAIKAYSALPDAVDLEERIDVLMLSKVADHIKQKNGTALAVIDEAHHGAAASYQQLFNQPTLGILGLTATPSRHDGLPLSFDRESYSIGFPDLVKLGVLLQPKIVEVSGGSYDIESIGDDESFEVLNNHTRNAAILNALNDMGDKLTKGIVYVGTAQHARDLFAAIRKSSWASRFHTLALVLGSERKRILTQAGQEFAQEPRRDFMQALKSAPSALIVNVDVLTEGFDDPGVNTVVMARPTRSKLVYMQAIGRAVRLNADDLSKQAYIVEVVDDLPNIRYRIDNRWLYSDVSDLLEPSVEDRFYSSSSQLEEMIQRIFVEFNVPQAARGFPVLEEHDRVSMLLFKVYRGAGKDYEHVPLVITNANRVRASNFFNFLSMRMKTLRGSDIETAIKPVLPDIAQFAAGAERQGRKRLFYAMQNAFELVNMPSETPESIRDAQPWITFIAFRFELPVGDLSDDLRKFTDDMSNRDWVRETLRADAVSAEFALAKMPLPLSGFVGVFLAPGEMTSITDTVEKLRSHSSVQDGVLQWTQTKLTIGTAALPVESRFVDALPTIVREDLDYFRWLNPRNKGEI